MKHFLILAFIIWSLQLPGCKCNDDNITVTPDTTIVSQLPGIQVPVYFNVFGALVAIRQVNRLPDSVSSELAYAMLFDGPSNTLDTPSMVDAGQVSVNTIPLNKGANNMYKRTGADGYLFPNLNFSQNISWYVQGNDGIPPSSYLMTGKFPRYWGNYPSLISRSEGLTFTFDASTLIYADSVFVTISAGNKLIIKRYAANSGTVNIASEELMALQKCPTEKPGYLQISPASCSLLPWYDRPTIIIKESAETRFVVIE